MKIVFYLFVIVNLAAAFLLADTTKVEINRLEVTDGPYVKFINDSTVLVQYVDKGKVVAKEIHSPYPITFNGFGYDSLNSYSISEINEIKPAICKKTTSKLFAFSDMHGEYEFLCELLINNKVIDSNLHWSFGDGHLVVIGDMMDRGDKVTEILWMIYRLETEAKNAGGEIHYLLGNHEIMVLQDDLRYLHEKYISVTTPVVGSTQSELYDSLTVLGRWLRSKNIVEVINGMLFVHAGLSPSITEKGFSLELINTTMRTNIDTEREVIKSDSLLSYLFRGFGPIWYRGYHFEMENYKQATSQEVDALLAHYNLSNIIVGHSVLDSIGVSYGGKVLGVNQDYEMHDEIEGLYWEKGFFYACDIFGRKRQLVVIK